MKSRFLNTVMAVGLSASFAIAGVAPVASAPLNMQSQFVASSPIVLAAQNDRRDRRDYKRRGQGYHNGYRGYRHKRPGYRQQNGFWFPLAAFGLGAIIGGAVAGNGGGSAHVQWCNNHYRSYRAYDNTFQPYNGPRRACYSPYS